MQPHLSCVGAVAVVIDCEVPMVNLSFGLREFQFGVDQVFAKAVANVTAVLLDMHLLTVGGLAIEQDVAIVRGCGGGATKQERGVYEDCGGHRMSLVLGFR